jgi:hypothetical protein
MGFLRVCQTAAVVTAVVRRMCKADSRKREATMLAACFAAPWRREPAEARDFLLCLPVPSRSAPMSDGGLSACGFAQFQLQSALCVWDLKGLLGGLNWPPSTTTNGFVSR